MKTRFKKMHLFPATSFCNTCITKAKTVFFMLGALLTTHFMLLTTAFADQIATDAQTSAGKEVVRIVVVIINELRTISIPIAVVCAIVAFLTMVFSKNEKVVGPAQSRLKRIVIALVIIILIGPVIDSVLEITGQESTYSSFIK